MTGETGVAAAVGVPLLTGVDPFEGEVEPALTTAVEVLTPVAPFGGEVTAGRAVLTAVALFDSKVGSGAAIGSSGFAAAGSGVAVANTSVTGGAVGGGSVPRGRPSVRAASTAAPMTTTTTTSQSHGVPGPLPRRLRVVLGRRRACATPAEYRCGASAESGCGCYKPFTDVRHRQQAPDTDTDTDTDIGHRAPDTGAPDTDIGHLKPTPLMLNENADPNVVSDLLNAFADPLGDGPRQRTLQIQVLGERASGGPS